MYLPNFTIRYTLSYAGLANVKHLPAKFEPSCVRLFHAGAHYTCRQGSAAAVGSKLIMLRLIVYIKFYE